jgi:hypothetical protein
LSKPHRTEVYAQNTYPILGLRVTIGRRTTWPVIVVVVWFKATAGSVAPGLTPFTHFCPLFPFALSTVISYNLKVMLSKSHLNLAYLFSTQNVQPKKEDGHNNGGQQIIINPDWTVKEEKKM